MVKFLVVLFKRPDLTVGEFHRYLADVHGPMAERIRGLRRYVQNHRAEDPTRKHPGWDAVVELSFDDRPSMEAAWRSPEGEAATADLAAFADLARSSWSIVEEFVRRP